MTCGCNSTHNVSLTVQMSGVFLRIYYFQRVNSRESLRLEDDFSDSDKNETKKTTCKKTTKWSLVTVLILIILAFVVIWVIIPVSFMLSLSFQTFMVFIPIDSPRNPNFDSPEDFGIQGVYNFYRTTTDFYDNLTETSIGCWLILHEDDINTTTSNDVTEILQNTDRDIVVYLHGVLSNRAKAIEQYKVLRKHFLIVAIDHRGYGDSGTNVRQGELGAVHDHVQIYDWIKSVNSENSIYYWGHSLGSALSTHTLRLLNELNKTTPTGLILESPFTSIEDVLLNTVFGTIFSWLPYFDATILRPLDNNGLHFRSKENILSVDCPIMILHAEDDGTILIKLGERLAEIAKQNRTTEQGEVLYHAISADYGCGHNDILINYPNIDSSIEEFKAVCRNFSTSS